MEGGRQEGMVEPMSHMAAMQSMHEHSMEAFNGMDPNTVNAGTISPNPTTPVYPTEYPFPFHLLHPTQTPFPFHLLHPTDNPCPFHPLH
jgi:hypothetical protein